MLDHQSLHYSYTVCRKVFQTWECSIWCCGEVWNSQLWKKSGNFLIRLEIILTLSSSVSPVSRLTLSRIKIDLVRLSLDLDLEVDSIISIASVQGSWVLHLSRWINIWPCQCSDCTGGTFHSICHKTKVHMFRLAKHQPTFPKDVVAGFLHLVPVLMEDKSPATLSYPELFLPFRKSWDKDGIF